ncbi:FAD-dependent monooxygenase [Saccharopolyspora sp. K220]|uniref:FAD-dependent monooxygenase n=1 Tax=Saccharopolyspora soli TaxID=2926618 RepID=UPI001F59F5A2|nr:FAD-dependent monooxygenase [Saccharopolyspora soli]MCI2418915.1 FAD-dependent monooxygenase [Saccharopolyspora soli]
MLKKVLISGASVAGPALACWLGRYGFEPTVVEIAPALRGGGRAVDFRGEAHLTVLERMGVLAELRDIQTGGSPMTFVDERGRTLLHLPAHFAGGDVEVLRSDLARVLYERSADVADYVFGDSAAELTETPGGVEVTFASGAQRCFDLVIGADGVHSGVRRLAFGPEERFVSHLGYYVATWDLPNYLGLPPGSLNYNAPGRLVSVGCDFRDSERANAFVVFKAPRLDYDRHDLDQQRRLITDAFGDLGWEAPRLLASLGSTEELYFDSISRVDVDPWSRGRISLVGDAAGGATIGGMGTGTAIVAAYVLAGELAAADGDHRAAFARYESLVRDYATGCQVGGDRTGKFLAPGRFGRWARNLLLGNEFLLNQMLKAGQDVSSGIDLPCYDLPHHGAGATRSS